VKRDPEHAVRGLVDERVGGADEEIRRTEQGDAGREEERTVKDGEAQPDGRAGQANASAVRRQPGPEAHTVAGRAVRHDSPPEAPSR
jgi:hypothetical protein